MYQSVIVAMNPASADVKAKITLSNNSISAEGDGVEVVDKTITINSCGYI